MEYSTKDLESLPMTLYHPLIDHDGIISPPPVTFHLLDKQPQYLYLLRLLIIALPTNKYTKVEYAGD